MSEAESSGYLLPHDLDADGLATLLGGTERCQVGDTATYSLKYYDSFDWRLHNAGLRLLHVQGPAGGVLRLKPAAGGDAVEAVAHDAEPDWPDALPPGTLRDQLQQLLEMRVLLPLATVRGRVTELSVLNDDAKTVVRLQLMRLDCTAPGIDQAYVLAPRLRPEPVKGYDKDRAQMAAFLSGDMQWTAAPACLFDEVMAAVDRTPGDYSSKLDVPLQRGQKAVDAMRTILLTLLDTLERNIPGTRADLDSEFLHDLRVATRRTRSALSQVKWVLPEPVVEDFKQRFAWLGQVTGPTRDLDVFLLELPRYRSSLPRAMAGDLDALEAYLRKTQRREQAKLKRKLGSSEMVALVRDWRAILEARAMPGEPGRFADLPTEQVASQRIWRMYKRVLKAGRAVTVNGPAEEMHELRKDCKKLRYLIEFFRGLYPAGELKGLIRTLKELLDNLGEFQDLEVQADKLRAFAAEFAHDDAKGLPTVLAIGALVADLLRHQQAAHDRFAGCFAHFDSAENRARYKGLFRAEGGKFG